MEGDFVCLDEKFTIGVAGSQMFLARIAKGLDFVTIGHSIMAKPLIIFDLTLLTDEGIQKLKTIAYEEDMEIVRSQAYFFMMLHCHYYNLTSDEVKIFKSKYAKCKTRKDYIEFVFHFDLNLTVISVDIPLP